MATPSQVTAPVSIKPGVATSEGWLTALTILLGSLPAMLKALGVTYDISPLVQAVGLIISGLSGIHFTAQRTSLKKAVAGAARSSSLVPAALAASAATIATIALLACGAGKTTGTQILDGAGSAASAGLHCEAVNLEQDIGATGLTLLATVAKDLLAADFAGAFDALISTVGGQAVGCAVLAVEDFEQALEAVGSAAATGALAPGSLLQRARAAQAHYGWTKAPAATKSAFRTRTATPSSSVDVGTGDLSSARKKATASGSASGGK